MMVLCLCFNLSLHADNLGDACYNHDLAKVKNLVEKKRADVNAKDDSGWTALMTGAQQKDLEIVTYLTEKGADVNAATKDGLTVLMVASYSGTVEIVRYLLDKKADINAVHSNGMTALTASIGSNRFDIADCLIKRGADVTKQDTLKHWTALMYAVDSGNLEMVQKLVDAGSDINPKSGSSQSPFSHAVDR